MPWSRLVAMCPQHPGEQVAGRATVDGETVLYEKAEASGEEFVGWVPTDEERATLLDSPLGAAVEVAVAEPDRPGDQHFRLMPRCSRPSCSYRPVLRSDSVEPINEIVRALWRNGQPELVVADIEVCCASSATADTRRNRRRVTRRHMR